MKKLLFVIMMFTSINALAASQRGSVMSYDVSGGVGSYAGNSYSELHLGLNYFPEEWLNWRNSAFTKFGSSLNTIYGLDSALLFQTSAYTQSRGAGVEVFLGPGVRLASENNNAGFAQGGITFSLAGLRLGFGAQALHYWASDRRDKNDVQLPNDEINYFITVSGGGIL